MKNRKLLITGVLVVLSVVLIYVIFGVILSEKKPKETSVPVALKKETPKKTEELVPQKTQQYESENLRDPFAPLIVKRQINQKKLSPLEMYDIEELKLTGIVSEKRGAYALIQTPDGRFYIAREKDKIGISGGIITKIGRDFIEIYETPAYGGISAKTKQLKLRAEE